MSVTRTSRIDSCMKQANFNNIGGRRTAGFCEPNADDDIVNARHRYCSHYSCEGRRTFNVKGSTRRHTSRSILRMNMVYPRARRFLHDVLQEAKILQCLEQQGDGVLQAVC